jgi:hypothetical protein
VRAKDAFVIALNEKPLATLSASDLSFFRVAPLGDTEYIIVELWQPGLNCHHSYALIAVHTTRTAEMSPVFGQCTELHGASHLKGGLKIELRPAAQNVLSRDNHLQVYWFVKGKIARLPISRRP